LPPRKNPYWVGISGGRGGLSLGYRKPNAGAGSWIVKAAIDGARIEERINEILLLSCNPNSAPQPKAGLEL
jgi:hypothetical protein